MTRYPEPPRLARRLLARALPIDVRDEIAGDLNEIFRDRCASHGVGNARIWFWKESVTFSRRFLMERFPNRRSRMRGLFEGWTTDLKHAARQLLRSPGFTLVTAGTLAIAIGANAAIFSVVDAVLINPLSHPNADRIVVLRAMLPGTQLQGEVGLGPEFFVTYRDEADKLEDIGMTQSGQTTVKIPNRVDRLFISVGTSSLFTTLGAQAAMGRLPNKDDDAKAAPVTVISDWLWRDWFNSDPNVVGKTIEVSGQQRTIIGVMRPEFRFPNAQIALWMRAAIADEKAINPGSFNVNLVARMKPGVTTEELAAQLAIVAKRIPQKFGGSPQFARQMERHQPVVRTLEDVTVGRAQRPLWVLLGTVSLVFLIACANVANLFIVRAETRRRDLAVRQALGASRLGLVRGLLTEALLLAALGGTAGALLAWLGVPALVAAAPEGIPNLDLVALDAGPLLYTLGLTVLAGLIFGLAPAIQFSKPAVAGELRQGGRSSTTGGRLARNVLVVLQTASALVLLVGAALLARSFFQLTRVELGYTTENIFTFQVAPSGPDFNNGPAFQRFHFNLMDRIRALPGVELVGVVNELPLDEGAGSARIHTDRTLASGSEPLVIPSTMAGGDYFQAMNIRLLKGRFFQPQDHVVGAANALVSRSAAEKMWPGEDPIGKRLMHGPNPSSSPWLTVVGVVDDVRLEDFRQERPDPLIYRATVGPQPNSWGIGSPAYVVKTRRAEVIAPEIRAIISEVAPGSPMYRVFTMKHLAHRANAPLSFTMLMLVIAASLAVILGAVGVYSVLSYVVAQRTPEIAVRMALGAEAPAVRRMVVAQGSKVTAIGVVIGIAAALALTKYLGALLFEVKALDPATFVAMPLLMLAIAVIACYFPARRASAVDPLRALRGE